jgi:hypothetical protein
MRRTFPTLRSPLFQPPATASLQPPIGAGAGGEPLGASGADVSLAAVSLEVASLEVASVELESVTPAGSAAPASCIVVPPSLEPSSAFTGWSRSLSTP